jgi:hypothetical protein
MENLIVKAENGDYEKFIEIEEFEGLYKISSYGRVYSLISNKFLKTCKNKDGYSKVILYKDGKPKNYKVHRLVAQAFIPNPSNLPQINHKDENPSNNHLENLEWCDSSYNINYGSRTERAISKMVQNSNWRASHEKCGKPKKQVLQFDKQGKFVAEFSSTREAERQTGIDHGHISQCCNGNKKYSHAGGFIWKFKEEEVA